MEKRLEAQLKKTLHGILFQYHKFDLLKMTKVFVQKCVQYRAINLIIRVYKCRVASGIVRRIMQLISKL